MKTIQIIALATLFLSFSVGAYEVKDSEIDFVCQSNVECINIVNDELADITIDGNLRNLTPAEFRESIADYCDTQPTIECRNYSQIMIKTFDQAYKDGDK